MLRVSLAAARPGMRLALPIYHPRRPGTVLLKADIALEQRVIDRLREIELRELWIQYPGMDFIAETVCPEIFASHARLAGTVADAFEEIAIAGHASLDWAAYRRAIAGLLDNLIRRPRAALFVQELLGDASSPIARHATNVCFISLLMGLKLDDYLVSQRTRLTARKAREVTNLGVGAMMHDVGMLYLDPETLDRWNRDHDETDPAWQAHVRIGYELVRGAIGPAAAAVVLHHHQRYDGSGFPRRRTLAGEELEVAGSDIHIFARIVAAADMFERLRNPADAPGAELRGAARRPTVRALRALREPPHRDWIDPVVYRALLSVVPPYPPGSMVRLSDGTIGVVEAWRPTDPCRPVVREISLAPERIERGLDDDARSIDLLTVGGVQIVEAEGFDVSRDNFYPASPGEFDLTMAHKARINGAARYRRTA
ncbi:MAG: HD-GYP domain-containing protein [Phycisphaerales bacterium JB039]